MLDAVINFAKEMDDSTSSLKDMGGEGVSPQPCTARDTRVLHTAVSSRCPTVVNNTWLALDSSMTSRGRAACSLGQR